MQKIASVLLVDDDATSNFITSNIIRRLNLAESIHSAKNGVEALTSLELEMPDVVFLDLHMPVMNGFEFLEQLVVQIPDYASRMKIFILSSSTNHSDMERIKKYSIDGYISKPINIEKIQQLQLLES